MKKALLMVSAIALGALLFSVSDVKEVKADSNVCYNYGTVVKVWAKNANGEDVLEYHPRTYTVDQVWHNYELLQNINKIQVAELEARTALEVVGATQVQIQNLQPLVAAKQQELLVNPSLQPIVDEMVAKLNSLQSQYATQLADYQAKQALFETYRATLPTEGYDAGMCNCFYGSRGVNMDQWDEIDKCLEEGSDPSSCCQ